MNREIWCPRCNQGWVWWRRLSIGGNPFWVCEECEGVWFGAGPAVEKQRHRERLVHSFHRKLTIALVGCTTADQVLSDKKAADLRKAAEGA